MKTAINPSRRKFLKDSAAVGGGLVLGVHLPSALAQSGAGASSAPEINAWVIVRPDDTVVIRYARAEMGQGSFTSLPMFVAEELECDWNKVKVEFISLNQHVRRKRVWGNTYSTGSRSVRESHEYLRKAGATAREMLIAAAANQWDVPPNECLASRGVISHKLSGKRTTFGKVANTAAKMEPPVFVQLKDPKDWKLLGTSPKRLDIPDSTTGRQRYGVDAQLPGMAYAAIVQCPVFGGKLKSADAAKVQGMRGVIKVVPLESAVAVVADNWWRAQQALKALPVEWDVGANGNASSASILEFMRAGLSQPQAATAKNTGDVDKAFASAARVIEAEYSAPYLSHAPMEPMGATALVKGGRVDVWTSTQNAEATLANAASVGGVPQENVEVHTTQNGGGFGRRGGSQDYTRLAVQVAKVMEGTPVKSLWTREEDMQHDFYRPASVVRMKVGVDASGNPTGWYTRIACPSILATLVRAPLKDGVDPTSIEGFNGIPYAIPNQRLEYAQRNTHVPVGFWRSVGLSQNPFFRESFVDELAHAARKDPFEYRRALLAKSPKDLAVLEACAKAAGWGSPLPAGRFRGIAHAEGWGSYTSAAVEISMNAKGEMKILRVVEAIDPGYIVNRDNVVAQVQGGVVYGLTAAVYGEITIKNGRVEQSHYLDYAQMYMRDMPKIEAVLVPSGGFWGGVGEPTLSPVAPALCNAVFAATGKRIRSLPLKNHGITLVKA